MEEARPSKVFPPKEGEPVLSVGMVIGEDDRSEVSIVIPVVGSYELIAGASRNDLKAGQELTVSLDEPSLPWTIYPKDTIALAPQVGLTIKDVVAGRSFHWKKNIDVTVPGNVFIDRDKDGKSLIVTNYVLFEDYLACLIASEMNASCPAAFIRAQATAARSWAYVFLRNKHPHEPFDVCNDDDCQRYQGTTHLSEEALAAVAECRGQFLLSSKGFVLPAYYSKCCGGHQELAENVFGFIVPGLSADVDGESKEEAYCSPKYLNEQALSDYLGVVDEDGSYFRWQLEVDSATIIASLKNRFGLQDVKSLVDLRSGKRGVSGRLKSLTIVYMNDQEEKRAFDLSDQYDIRKALHDTFLYSSAFDYEFERKEDGAIDSLKLSGKGWGHGVGLCQMGALAMALEGMDYCKILRHYYPETSLERVYP